MLEIHPTDSTRGATPTVLTEFEQLRMPTHDTGLQARLMTGVSLFE
jgi:hypothetical protein